MDKIYRENKIQTAITLTPTQKEWVKEQREEKRFNLSAFVRHQLDSLIAKEEE